MKKLSLCLALLFSTGVFAKSRGFFDLASELAVQALFWIVLLAISIALLRKQER